MTTQRIRALALCVFHHDGKILVNEFTDPVTQQTFLRPIGGGIDFGETSAEAVVREVQEELGLPITDVRLIGTLESLFTYAGKPGHEIVRVYDAKFLDSGVYELPYLNAQESDGAAFTAAWHSCERFTNESPLVPDGLYDLLKKIALLD
ncbi:NUDIX hydrolase [Pseudomonas frederiksbergensis]|uniref:RNA pyrophosphohydrolase n=1 Tax=Pseudomonas frederiksbergensis TaxID=104087 RepID=A0A6L5BSU9_9PSED|nr:NUDIX hydrolase [Pseudomonas frederiksbergensis]KAF2391709.1 RNA pyrophosphohydrolase [Pseudomonas frederiksbergensis]